MLKLQYFGYLMWRANSLEKTLMPGKTEGRRIRGLRSMRQLLNGYEFEQTTPEDREGQESLACCSPQVAKSLTRLSEWTVMTTEDHIWYDFFFFFFLVLLDFFYINIWNRQIYIDGKQISGCLGLWLEGGGKWLLICMKFLWGLIKYSKLRWLWCTTL